MSRRRGTARSAIEERSGIVNSTRRCIKATAATVVVAGGVLLFPSGGGGAQGAVVVGPAASTTLKNQAGAAVGTVDFQQLSGGHVKVRATITGLGPASDFHGFHIHTNGDCSGDFTGAGGHWNPTGTTHGDHTGDMAIQFAATDGVARSNFTTDAFTVDQMLADPGGVAVIVHAGRDNFGNIPARYSPDGGATSGPDATTNNTGDAGARYACGVIGTGFKAMGTAGGAAGHWSAAHDGGVLSRGDAGFFGSEGRTPLNSPVVGIAATPSRQGYYLAGGDGGVFAHGDAGFAGSLGGMRLAQPVVGIATPPSHARAVLRDQAGGAAGQVTFTQVGNRVRASALVTGLAASSEFHGFHVHANGDCSGDFTAAGGHWNAGGTTHGDHTGDMPSVFADASGTARAVSYLDAFTVAQMLSDPGGIAVIVHAGRDNFANIPTRYTVGTAPGGPDATTNGTGDSGGRSVCGVVAPTGGTTGPGYWLAARDGGVFAEGDAPFRGSLGGVPLNAPIVGIASTPTGDGYWLVGRDGGVFAFGDAGFYGSAGRLPLNAPIVAIVATPTGRGYRLFAADGGVFAYGDATFEGATPAATRRIVGATATESGHGYWLFGAGGATASFGDAELTDLGPQTLNAPIVGGA
jgi:Cu/Zn superoxide dismutase